MRGSWLSRLIEMRVSQSLIKGSQCSRWKAERARARIDQITIGRHVERHWLGGFPFLVWAMALINLANSSSEKKKWKERRRERMEDEINVYKIKFSDHSPSSSSSSFYFKIENKFTRLHLWGWLTNPHKIIIKIYLRNIDFYLYVERVGSRKDFNRGKKFDLWARRKLCTSCRDNTYAYICYVSNIPCVQEVSYRIYQKHDGKPVIRW